MLPILAGGEGYSIADLRKLSDEVYNFIRTFDTFIGQVSFIMGSDKQTDDTQVETCLKNVNFESPSKLQKIKDLLSSGIKTPMGKEHQELLFKLLDKDQKKFKALGVQLKYLHETGEPLGAGTLKAIRNDAIDLKDHAQDFYKSVTKWLTNVQLGRPADFDQKNVTTRWDDNSKARLEELRKKIRQLNDEQRKRDEGEEIELDLSGPEDNGELELDLTPPEKNEPTQTVVPPGTKPSELPGFRNDSLRDQISDLNIEIKKKPEKKKEELPPKVPKKKVDPELERRIKKYEIEHGAKDVKDRATEEKHRILLLKKMDQATKQKRLNQFIDKELDYGIVPTAIYVSEWKAGNMAWDAGKNKGISSYKFEGSYRIVKGIPALGVIASSESEGYRKAREILKALKNIQIYRRMAAKGLYEKDEVAGNKIKEEHNSRVKDAKYYLRLIGATTATDKDLAILIRYAKAWSIACEDGRKHGKHWYYLLWPTIYANQQPTKASFNVWDFVSKNQIAEEGEEGTDTDEISGESDEVAAPKGKKNTKHDKEWERKKKEEFAKRLKKMKTVNKSKMKGKSKKASFRLKPR